MLCDIKRKQIILLAAFSIDRVALRGVSITDSPDKSHIMSVQLNKSSYVHCVLILSTMAIELQKQGTTQTIIIIPDWQKSFEH